MFKSCKLLALFAGAFVSMAAAVHVAAQPVADEPAVVPPVENQPAQADQPIQPPAILADLLAQATRTDEQSARRAMGWEELRATIEPVDITQAGELGPLAPLGDAAHTLLEQSEEALARGEAFRAVQLLREAEVLNPNHVEVLRRLGMAYTQAGNGLRAASYLERAYRINPNDTRSLLMLCVHSGAYGELEEAVAWSQAASQAGYAALSDYYLHEALLRFGYDAAAAQRMSIALDAAAELDTDALAQAGQTDPAVLAELRILSALQPELRFRLGDMLLALGRFEEASAQYERTSAQDTADPGAVVARRAYVALLAGDRAKAIDVVLGLLGSAFAKQADAQLVGYLFAQGIDRQLLSDRLQALMSDQGSSLPLLAGLVQVSEQDLVIQVAQATLAQRDSDPQLYGQILGLFEFGDDDRTTAEPLARLLAIGADQVRTNPDLAEAYAQAVVERVESQVCLLRALMRADFVDEDDASRMLLSGMLYEQLRRRGDALRCYERAIELEPALAQGLRIELVNLLMNGGQVERALALLGEPEPDADWEVAELYAMGLLLVGNPNEAGNFLENWHRTRGEDNRAGIMRAQLSAWTGDPQDACRRLLRMINVTPKDETLYATAFDLIINYGGYFHTEHLANNNYRLFLNLIKRNMPNSITSRVEHARFMLVDPDFFDDQPDLMEQAEGLLLSVLADEPDNILAIWSLVEFYEMQGDAERAGEMFALYVDQREYDLNREIIRAQRALRQGDNALAEEVLLRVLALEEEGVMPGTEMDGSDAWSVLTLLGTANPERELDAQMLAMIRRFPQDVLINNGIGYQWTLEEKNLLQAREMISRALELGGDNASVLDSMGWVCYKLGDFDQAAAYMERAIQVLLRTGDNDGSRAVLHDHMGDILYRQGNVSGARRMWLIASDVRITPLEMTLDPELATMRQRLDAKLDALEADQEPPIAGVPGPESHGPAGHPADPVPLPEPPQPPLDGQEGQPGPVPQGPEAPQEDLEQQIDRAPQAPRG